MNKIIENATIYFKNGKQEFYKSILLREKGVCVGTIINDSDNNTKFVDQEFIPLYQIQKIIVFNEQGKSRDINF